MNIKKLKRKCSVRGCSSTDVYALSLTRECGNSVIICKDCIKNALSEISKTEKKGKKEDEH